MYPKRSAILLFAIAMLLIVHTSKQPSAARGYSVNQRCGLGTIVCFLIFIITSEWIHERCGLLHRIMMKMMGENCQPINRRRRYLLLHQSIECKQKHISHRLTLCGVELITACKRVFTGCLWITTMVVD